MIGEGHWKVFSRANLDGDIVYFGSKTDESPGPLSTATGLLALAMAARDHWKPGFLGQSGVDPGILICLGILFRKYWTSSMSPHPGDVWLADLGLAAKTRPVVVVWHHDPDSPRELVLFLPLTTQGRQSRYEVALPKLHFLDRYSVANVQGLGSVPAVRLERRIGSLPEAGWSR